MFCENNFFKPIIFGEIIFDVFENGEITAGGAPFNVAWHLRGFGADPVLISRIGNDEYGKSVIDFMNLWNLNTSCIQIDFIHPTGKAYINIKNGTPEFEIPPNQSFDFINFAPNIIYSTEPNAILYHGSLALRSFKNQKTVSKIIGYTNPYVITDINLRYPWWNIRTIESILHSAHTLKLNIDELTSITSSDSCRILSTFENLKFLLIHFKLDFIFLTMGHDGAIALDKNNQLIEAKASDCEKIIDTVGAGDAFSAVIILGKLYNWNTKTTLRRAVQFAGKICAVRGAVSFDKELYRNLLSEWKKENNP